MNCRVIPLAFCCAGVFGASTSHAIGLILCIPLNLCCKKDSVDPISPMACPYDVLVCCVAEFAMAFRNSCCSSGGSSSEHLFCMSCRRCFHLYMTLCESG